MAEERVPGFFARHRKLVIFSVLLLLLGAGAYVARRKVINAQSASEIVTAQIRSLLHRRFQFRDVRYSGADGLVFEDISLGERDSYASGDFIKAKRLAIRLKWKDMVKKQFLIEEIRLTEPTVVLKRKGKGAWNFSDFAAIPKGDGSLQWDLSRLGMENGRLLVVDDKTSTSLMVSTVNASVSLHRAAPFAVKAETDFSFSGILRGKAASGAASLSGSMQAGATAVPAKTEGEFSLRGVSAGDYSARRLELRWNLDGLDRPLVERKISVELDGESLLLENLNASAREKGWAYWLLMPVEMLSKAKGFAPPDMDRMAFPAAVVSIKHKAGEWDISKLRLDGDVVRMDISGTINARASSMNLALDVAVPNHELDVRLKGSLRQPEIEPCMSESITGGLNAGFAKLDETLSKLYSTGGK